MNTKTKKYLLRLCLLFLCCLLSYNIDMAFAETWNDPFHLFINEGGYGGQGTYDSDDSDADGDGIENNSIVVEEIKLANDPTSGTNSPPSVGTVTPSNGNSQLDVYFSVTATYSDPDGSADLGYADLQIRTQTDDVTHFWTRYDKSDGLIYVSDGSGGWLLPGYAPGSVNTISNAYATIDCQQTQVVDNPSSDTLSVTWTVKFNAGGTAEGKVHDLFIHTKDLNLSTEWEKKGAWAVEAGTGVNNLPYNGLVTPQSGNVVVGQDASITAAYHDADGFGDITSAHLEIHTDVVPRFKAYFDNRDGEKKLYVRNDADTAWIGGLAPGSDAVIENSYAKLKCLDIEVAYIGVGGDTVEVKWVIEFKRIASGKSHRIYISTEDLDPAQSILQESASRFVWIGNPIETGFTALKATCDIIDIGWAGLFLQEGEVSDVTSSRDVSRYSDSQLHFWVRTPIDLQVSLRSQNVIAGNETSILKLSDRGIPADNDWHEVNIPMSEFTTLDTNLYLSQMKVYFDISAVGAIVGSAFQGEFLLYDIKYARNKTATPKLVIEVRKHDGSLDGTGKITWLTSGDIEGEWEIADQYLEIDYDNSDANWGAQVYTDNMGDSASPKYEKDPTQFLKHQPSGLIGEIDKQITCPMAWMVLEATNSNIPRPVEIQDGNVVNFKSDVSGMWGGVEAESEWSYLKDISATKWIGDIDTDNYPDPDTEIVLQFAQPFDEYSTFINNVGMGTGWSRSDGTRKYILNPEVPIVLYFAADFGGAKIKQLYKTNTITIELYHY